MEALLILLVIIYAIYAKIRKIEIAAVLVLLYFLWSQKEGMNERTDMFSWFEPEGYGTSHSVVNPEIKPLMYKYAFEPTSKT